MCAEGRAPQATPRNLPDLNIPEHSRLASALKRNTSMSWTTLHRQLEELNLVKCSLLPGEELIFNDPAVWESLLDTYPDSPTTNFTLPASPACFQVKTNGSSIHFEVELPKEYGESLGKTLPRISVKGDGITRVEQERWQSLVKEQVSELQGNSECVWRRRNSSYSLLIALWQISGV